MRIGSSSVYHAETPYCNEKNARPKKKRTTAEHPKAAANKRPKRARNSYAYYVSHAIGALRAAEPSAARGELMSRIRKDEQRKGNRKLVRQICAVAKEKLYFRF